MSNMVVSIDGPAASGKSTIAKLVAKKLGAYYINTGNMYRAAALAAINNKLDLDNIDDKILSKFIRHNNITYAISSDNKMVLMLNNKPVDSVEIRTPEVSQNSSKIAASKVIREWLVCEQRTLVKFDLIVMEGRDIGTNVFPNAKYKFFLTASPEERAIRRLKQDQCDLSKESIVAITKEITERDERDSRREVAPLQQANDAILVDSSDMNIDEVVDYVIQKINEKM